MIRFMKGLYLETILLISAAFTVHGLGALITHLAWLRMDWRNLSGAELLLALEWYDRLGNLVFIGCLVFTLVTLGLAVVAQFFLAEKLTKLGRFD